ncbi:MAG: SpoIIIAH-like family protein [Ruminococcaceae bacterium]|nr:SpoIIIAH-like family protein [Oscillospiraceae bacterium]
MKFDIMEKIKNMSMRTKRLIALAVCLVLLAVAVVQNAGTQSAQAGKPAGEGNVNVNTDIGEDDGSEVVSEGEIENIGSGVIKVDDKEEYFATVRLNKLNQRSEAEESCNEIIGSETSGENSVAEAVAKIESLREITQIEENLETNITARGYDDVFVIIENECVYITVSAESLDANEASAIAVSACDITGCEMDDIVLKGVY